MSVFSATVLAGLLAALPADTHLLHEPVAIEQFLEALDGSPPDWATLQGAHGDRHDDSLFALNRERDRLRAGRKALTQRITFLWDGVLWRVCPLSSWRCRRLILGNHCRPGWREERA